MPVTKDNYQKAQAALDAAKNNPGADPEKVSRLQMALNSFYETYNSDTTDQNGQRTTEPIGQKYPSTTAEKPLTQAPDSSHDFYYEPSTEQVRQHINQNPQLAEQLHIGSYVGSPDQIATLDPQSEAYKSIADEMYNQAAGSAKQSGKNLTRYRDISFKQNPFDYTRGLAGRVGPTLFSGLNKTFGGLLEPAAEKIDQALGTTPNPEQNSYDESRNTVSSPASTAVEYGGYFLPFAPGNLAARGVLGVGGYAGRGALGKLALGTLAGAAGANTQGVTSDIGNAVNNNTGVDSVLKSAYENAPMRALVGGALGGAGDIVAQGANAIRGSIRNAPSYKDLNTLEQAGGRTVPGKGVSAPKAVNENIRASNTPENRGIKTAADISAEKVAPPIHESLKAERELAVQEAEKNLGQYFKENEHIAHPTTEVADEIIGQLSRGYKVSPLGEVGNANPGLANKLRRHLGNFADVTVVGKDQAEGLVSKNNGRVLTPKEYEAATGKKFDGEGVPVILPQKLNPQQLHVAEQGIANELRYGANGEPVDDPALKAIQRALFQVRDKFTAPLGGKPPSEQPFELSNPGAKRSVGAGDTQIQSVAPEQPKSSTQSLEPEAIEDVTSESPSSGNLKNKYEQPASSAPTLKPVKKNGLEFTPSELEKAATVADGKAFYDELFNQGREARLREQRRLAESVGNEDKFAAGLARGQTENYEGAPPPASKRTPEAYAKTESPVPEPRNTEIPNVPEVKNIMKQTDEAASKLSPEELDAVHSYTSRKGDKVGTPEWESATKKLTVDEPTKAGALYSGTRLPEEEINKILKNGYSINKPTSTSYNKGISSAMSASREGRGNPVIFVFNKVKQGVSLASKKLGVAGTSGEREMLLTKGDYDAKSLGKDKDGNHVIQLTEKEPSKTQGDSNTAVLEDGTVVRGLSALQRKHHEALSALEEATKDTGGSNPKAIHRKVIGFKNGNDMFANQELSNQAKKLGLENQLHEVAATNVFPSLKERQNFEGRNGILNATKDAAILRLIDPLAGYIGNAPPNPFVSNPYSPGGRIQQYWLEDSARNMLNMQGGLPGARFGGQLANKIKEEEDRQAAEERMSQ